MEHIGLINKETGKLESVVTSEFFQEAFPEGTIEELNFETAIVPDSYPKETQWDPVAREFVLDWKNTDMFFHDKIDKDAGRFRRRFITTTPGQEMTYLQKRKEAESYTEGMDPAMFPMLYSESQAVGVSMSDLAATIVEKALEWEQLGALIESLRLTAKKAVTEATTKEAKAEAARVNWEELIPIS